MIGFVFGAVAGFVAGKFGALVVAFVKAHLGK